MGFPAEAGETDPQTVVVAFAGEGMGFALAMTVAGKDDAVRMPEVGAESGVGGVRKLRLQTAGGFRFHDRPF